MREVSWRDRVMDWLGFYGPLYFLIFIILGGLATLPMALADVRGLSGTVEDVVTVHGESTYSIVTIEGEKYRYDGDVAPEEGDEIIFTKEGGITFGILMMNEWHFAD